MLCHLFVAGWGSGPDMLRASNYSSQHCQMIKCFIIKCASEEQMKCILASLTCTNTLFKKCIYFTEATSPIARLYWERLDKSCKIIACPCMTLSFYSFLLVLLFCLLQLLHPTMSPTPFLSLGASDIDINIVWTILNSISQIYCSGFSSIICECE